MRCPYCQNQVLPAALECPNCRLTYPQANAFLGVMPRVAPDVSDTTALLTANEIAKLKRRTLEIEQRFTGLKIQVALHYFIADHPFSLHAFRMFNGGSFSGNANRGANNRSIFLLLDPARAESAIVVGYALEPLLSEQALGHLLEIAGPSWEEQNWTNGILRVLDGLELLLATVARPLESFALGNEF